MQPVYQTKFGGCDAPLEERGDCYSACLASILELELADVPNFHVLTEELGKQWHQVQNLWLQEHGLWAFAAGWTQEWEEMAKEIKAGPYTLNGRSPRGDYYHSVVAEAGEIVHDPAGFKFPSGPSLLKSTSEWPWHIEVLVPLNYPH